jgi:RimJ/RimL family protein N-acetyltransferase
VTVATLVTPRLTLRAKAPADREAFVALVTDAVVMRHVGDGRPLPPEEATRLFDDTAARAWSIVRTQDGDYLGHAWLVDELGFILRPAAWGQGHATEVALALVHHGLRDLALARIEASVDEDHPRSIRVLEKAGFRLTREEFDEQGRFLVYGVGQSEPGL